MNARRYVALFVGLLLAVVAAPAYGQAASGSQASGSWQRAELDLGSSERLADSVEHGRLADSVERGRLRVPMVVGGGPVAEGVWPSTVFVLAQYPDGSLGGCTGSLFGARWVLTAAHCLAFPSPSAVAVGVGSVDLNSPRMRGIPASQIFVNSDYRPPGSSHDIGFLLLSKPVTEAGVRLGRAAESRLWQAGAMGLILGWGEITPTGSQTSRMYGAEIPIAPDAACGVFGPQFVAGTMLCVGSPTGGVGTCYGDSGGPLYVDDDYGLPVQAGVTSYGGEICGQAGVPDVFTRVGAYSQGIVDFLRTHPVAPVAAPTVGSSNASSASPTRALVNATIDARGLATDYRIDFGTGGTFSRSVVGYAGGSGAVTVSGSLEGLTPGSSYVYRVVALNSAGEAIGSLGSFSTPGSNPLFRPPGSNSTPRDERPPSVRALASAGKAGARVNLRYRVWDQFSTKTRERITIKDRARVIRTLASRLSRSKEGVVYTFAWKTPANLTGTFSFCVEAWDASGNKSKPSCAPLRLR